MKIGVLCGHQMPRLMKKPERIKVDTPYGNVVMLCSTIGNQEVFFIQRHGEEENTPPHLVNYRGIIYALSCSHVSSVFSIGTVGSMKSTIQPGDLVLPHDFIDITKSRKASFYDNQRVHVDMTEPLCPSLRKLLMDSCTQIQDLIIHDNSVYLVTEGPRLETAAEIEFYSKGADIVGMTLAPEVILAREKGMCFASLCVVCNMAAGMQKHLPASDIALIYSKKEPTLSQIVEQTIASLDKKQPCSCSEKVSKASL
jgi:5'-methylthioadenosine phosphorylase